jgi:protein-S-isoprenylcysteine O-methyltransferase Ste14
MIERYLPLAGVVLFFAVGFVWRAWLHYRRHGRTGIILFRSAARRDQHLRDGLFVLLLVAATAQAALAAVLPESLATLSVVALPVQGFLLAAGAVLVFGGIIFMVLAQLHLGASWRIGIELGAAPGLVTRGFYTFCRNPIFLGMFVTLAGLVVLLPTVLSAAVLLGAVLCVRSQVLEEETYLLATYRSAYGAYARRVGRFLPGMGRLV